MALNEIINKLNTNTVWEALLAFHFVQVAACLGDYSDGDFVCNRNNLEYVWEDVVHTTTRWPQGNTVHCQALPLMTGTGLFSSWGVVSYFIKAEPVHCCVCGSALQHSVSSLSGQRYHQICV